MPVPPLLWLSKSCQVYGLCFCFLICSNLRYSIREGNFVTLAKRILTSVQAGDHKRSFFDKSGRYVFHYMVKDGVTYLCFATKEHKTSVCFAFLDEISKRFKATYDPAQIEGAMAYSPQFEEFSRVVEQEMNRFGQMKFSDNKISEVNEKVEQTKQAMKDNVQKVIERGENIETLIEKTDILVQRSDSFRVNTKTLERKLWWKNLKLWIILILVVIFLTWLIFSIVCGFDFGCLRGGSACFHESSRITYKGKTYEGMGAFADHPECRVPHIVRTGGVSVHTSCSDRALRLTDDHLIFSEGRGHVQAGLLKAGDVLFSDVDRTARCKVLSVVSEPHMQNYFGLNCLESVVLAEDVLCSTFGKYHAIPSAWMSVAGRVFGIDRASRFGDTVVEVLTGLKLL